MKYNLIARNETLARIVAGENIKIIHRPTTQASFETNSRELIMPIFKENFPDSCYVHTIVHECGHALYTPADWYPTPSENKARPGLIGYRNIIEDIRVNALMHRKYPGSKKITNEAYKIFKSHDMFGINRKPQKELDEMTLCDRINLYHKLNGVVSFNFTSEEKALVDLCFSVRQYRDVIDAANAVYDYDKRKKNEQSQDTEDSKKDSDPRQSESSGEPLDSDGEHDDGDGSGPSKSDDSSGDMDGNHNDDSDYFGDDSGDDDGRSDQSDHSDSEGRPETGNSDKGKPQSVTPETEQNFMKAIQAFMDMNKTQSVKYMEIPTIAEIRKNRRLKLVDNLYKKVLTDPKNKMPLIVIPDVVSSYNSYVNHMIGRFEMKKQAARMKTSETAKVGSIDTDRIHAYRFDDDVFERKTFVKDDKNHGFVFLLDWSGSMSGVIDAVFDQVCILAMFCHKTNIPFDVYAFYSLYGTELTLLHLMSSKMKKEELYKVVSNGTKPFLGEYSLGSTPLNAALVEIGPIFLDFVKNNHVDVRSLIVLTDGQSNSCKYSIHNADVIFDKETGKYYDTSTPQTDIFFNSIGTRIKSKVINYFLISGIGGYKRNSGSVKSKNVNDSSFMEVNSKGCDEYWYISVGRKKFSSMTTEERKKMLPIFTNFIDSVAAQKDA